MKIRKDSFFRMVAIPSVRVSVFRQEPDPARILQEIRGRKGLSQSPRFGSRCFVRGLREFRLPRQTQQVAIPSVRVSVFRQGLRSDPRKLSPRAYLSHL